MKSYDTFLIIFNIILFILLNCEPRFDINYCFGDI